MEPEKTDGQWTNGKEWKVCKKRPTDDEMHQSI